MNSYLEYNWICVEHPRSEMRMRERETLSLSHIHAHTHTPTASVNATNWINPVPRDMALSTQRRAKPIVLQAGKHTWLKASCCNSRLVQAQYDAQCARSRDQALV